MSNRARTGEEVRLAQLDELDDYEVADGYPDPRGWDVKARDGRKVGEVKHLLVDRQALRVAYLEVELERELSPDGYRGRDRERLVHVPVESAQLADGDDEVFVDLDRTALAGLGLADRTRPVVGSPEEHRRFFGARARGAAGDQYLVLHEEQIVIDKRQVQREAHIKKTVETEHVRESVPVRREEVTLERRPVSPEEAKRLGGEAQIGEDEIRVPLMREEIVAEKRVVPTEEVVVRKQAKTEHQVVDETVRKERVELDREAGEGRRGKGDDKRKDKRAR